MRRAMRASAVAERRPSRRPPAASSMSRSPLFSVSAASRRSVAPHARSARRCAESILFSIVRVRLRGKCLGGYLRDLQRRRDRGGFPLRRRSSLASEAAAHPAPTGRKVSALPTSRSRFASWSRARDENPPQSIFWRHSVSFSRAYLREPSRRNRRAGRILRENKSLHRSWAAPPEQTASAGARERSCGIMLFYGNQTKLRQRFLTSKKSGVCVSASCAS